jgi:hypothetical protein
MFSVKYLVGVTLPRPSRDEFVEYWKDVDAPFRLIRLAPHAIYIGGLAVIAIVVELISHSDSVLILGAVVGVVYALLFPPVGIWLHQRKRVRFFRCLHCGTYYRRERRWEDVIKTGRCPNCQKQVLRDFVRDQAA